MIGDCQNAEMRDRLPELLHDRLPEAQRAEVQAHLNGCADCREELALLGRIRTATSGVSIDTGRIVPSLPAYRAPSLWNRALRSPITRIAAGIVLVVGASLLVSDRVPPAGDQATVTYAIPDATTPVAPSVTGATSQVAVRSQPRAAELPVGEPFDDLTDSELQSLLRALESFEARTPVETEVVVPAVSRGGA
jgi:anti-sigma factor RsiW